MDRATSFPADDGLSSDRRLGLDPEWVRKVDGLPADRRAAAIVRKIVAALNLVLELAEMLLDGLDGEPRRALTSLLTMAAPLVGRAVPPPPARSVGKDRTALQRDARVGMTSVTLANEWDDLVGVTLAAPGYECKTLTLRALEADLLAVLLEDRGTVEWSGLPNWQPVDQVQKAMRQRARKRAERLRGKRGEKRAAPSSGVRPSAKSASRPSDGRRPSSGAGAFAMVVLRLRDAIERSGGNRWWVERDNAGHIRLLIRRAGAAGGGPTAPASDR